MLIIVCMVTAVIGIVHKKEWDVWCDNNRSKDDSYLVLCTGTKRKHADSGCPLCKLDGGCLRDNASACECDWHVDEREYAPRKTEIGVRTQALKDADFPDQQVNGHIYHIFIVFYHPTSSIWNCKILPKIGLARPLPPSPYPFFLNFWNIHVHVQKKHKKTRVEARPTHHPLPSFSWIFGIFLTFTCGRDNFFHVSFAIKFFMYPSQIVMHKKKISKWMTYCDFSPFYVNNLTLWARYFEKFFMYPLRICYAPY